jgi:hypothetical protein
VSTKQTSAAGQQYRKTFNYFVHYSRGNSAVGTDYFNVYCGALTFTVPRGQQAQVDLSATADLACFATSTTEAQVLCGARFVVNGHAALPENPGGFVWSGESFGQSDLWPGALDQQYVATCPATGTKDPCTYQVALQGRLLGDAETLTIYDLTVRVDVNYGTVGVTVVNDPCPGSTREEC